jgi:hypothetical protein
MKLFSKILFKNKSSTVQHNLKHAQREHTISFKEIVIFTTPIIMGPTLM